MHPWGVLGWHLGDFGQIFGRNWLLGLVLLSWELMLAKVFSGATVGLDGVLVEVEVDVSSQGFPAFKMVGTQWENLSLE